MYLSIFVLDFVQLFLPGNIRLICIGFVLFYSFVFV